MGHTVGPPRPRRSTKDLTQTSTVIGTAARNAGQTRSRVGTAGKRVPRCDGAVRAGPGKPGHQVLGGVLQVNSDTKITGSVDAPVAGRLHNSKDVRSPRRVAARDGHGDHGQPCRRGGEPGIQGGDGKHGAGGADRHSGRKGLGGSPSPRTSTRTTSSEGSRQAPRERSSIRWMRPTAPSAGGQNGKFGNGKRLTRSTSDFSTTGRSPADQQQRRQGDHHLLRPHEGVVKAKVAHLW
jgi:hypothetical protein